MHTFKCEAGNQLFTGTGALAPGCLTSLLQRQGSIQASTVGNGSSQSPHFGRVKNQVSFSFKVSPGTGRVLICKSISLIGRAQPVVSSL